MNTEIFSNIWAIVPFTPDDAHNIAPFLERHQWFLHGGGHFLFKTNATDAEQSSLPLLTRAGCELIQISDTSIYDAWNQAMDILENRLLESGTYITFLGLDDQLCEKYCLTVARHSRGAGAPDFLFGDAEYTLHNRIRYHASPEHPKLLDQDNLIFDVPHPGLMNKWSTIRNFRFDTRYRLAADFDFYIGITRNAKTTHHKVPEVQAIIGAGGISNSLEALEIYPREWALIAARRNVKLNSSKLKTRLLRTIATFPVIFHSLRRASWFIRGSQAINPNNKQST